jgi:hypothetical protein
VAVRRLLALALLASCSSERHDASVPEVQCQLADAPLVVHFDPPLVVLAPGASRPARVVVEPDVCARTDVRLAPRDPSIARAPDAVSVDPDHADPELVVNGTAIGATVLSATVTRADGAMATADLAIDVRDAAIPACKGRGRWRTRR